MKKRMPLTTNDTVALWGCVVSANVCGATGKPLGFAVGVVWLVFALAILYSRPEQITSGAGEA